MVDLGYLLGNCSCEALVFANPDDLVFYHTCSLDDVVFFCTLHGREDCQDQKPAILSSSLVFCLGDRARCACISCK